ncbi:MAG: hypothetical protein WCP39_01495 [Chlamydiota bacterium]
MSTNPIQNPPISINHHKHYQEPSKESVKKIRLDPEISPIYPPDSLPLPSERLSLFSAPRKKIDIRSRFTPPSNPVTDTQYTELFMRIYRKIPSIAHVIPESFSIVKAQQDPISKEICTGSAAVEMLLFDRRMPPSNEDIPREHTSAVDIENILVKHQIATNHLTFTVKNPQDILQLTARLQDIFRTQGGPIILEAEKPSRWVVLDGFLYENSSKLVTLFMMRDSFFGHGYCSSLDKIFDTSEGLPLHALIVKN